jgi:hypothetical protein
MGGARSKRLGNRLEGPISLRAEILVTHDPRVRERQVNAIRNFLLALSARLGDSATSDTRVGAQPTDDGLEALVGPLEADVVRVVWAAKAPLSVRQVLRKQPRARSSRAPHFVRLRRHRRLDTRQPFGRRTSACVPTLASATASRR